MPRKKTTEEFIQEAKLVHGDRYDYSKTEYTTIHAPVTIICSIHGEGQVGAIEHLKGANCYKCGKEAMASRCRKTKEQFIKEAKEVHGDKYDYSKVDYKNNHTHVIIGCPIHGDYKKAPDKHIGGSGCKKCLDKSNTKTTEKFIEESKIIHDNYYSYENTIYTRSNHEVIITCPIHGDYNQVAKSHRDGNGCLQCARESNIFSRSHYITLAETSNLYLIKCFNEEEEFYKIGKTIYNVKKRFSGKRLPYKYETVFKLNAEIGYIYDLEIELHKKYQKYKHKPSIDFDGRTECYSLSLPINEIISLG